MIHSESRSFPLLCSPQTAKPSSIGRHRTNASSKSMTGGCGRPVIRLYVMSARLTPLFAIKQSEAVNRAFASMIFNFPSRSSRLNSMLPRPLKLR